MTELAFRYATPNDASCVHELIERAYRDETTAGQWDSESQFLKGPRSDPYEIRAHILDPNDRFLLAELDGKLAGCALIQRQDFGTSQGAYFGMFAIDASARNAGLGKRILLECEARAAILWNASYMVMTVISLRTELIQWYERRGYALTGESFPFPFSETTGETRRDFSLLALRKNL